MATTDVELYGLTVNEATAEQIRDRLTEAGRADPEAAHVAEDQIARAALEAIRDGHPDPAGLADAVLVVLSAEYPMWCA